MPDARKTRMYLSPGKGEIEIEGHPIASVRSLTVEAEAGEKPHLVLNLLVTEVEIEGEIEVRVPDATRESLVKLGWTPPGE